METFQASISSYEDIAVLDPLVDSIIEKYDSTFAILSDSAKRFADQPALSWFEDPFAYRTVRTWTYRQYHQQVTHCIQALIHAGVKSIDPVAIVLPNLPEALFSLWAAQACSIAFPVNPFLSATEINHLIVQSNAQILITFTEKVAQRYQLQTDLLDRLQDNRRLKTIIVVGTDARDENATAENYSSQLLKSNQCNVYSYRALINTVQNTTQANTERIRRKTGHMPSSMFCTGGTTGSPKIAIRTHRSEVANAIQISSINTEIFATGKTLLCGLPLFHVNASMITGLSAILHGSHVLLAGPLGYRDKRLIQNFWNIVQEFKVSFFSAVPTVYSALLSISTEGKDLRSLEYGLSGAAPMPVELMKEFQSVTGIRILEGYGLTEGACASTCNPPLGARKIGSIGMRLPGQRLRCVKINKEKNIVRDCDPGEVGLLIISGANLFHGYLDSAQNIDVFLKDSDATVWLNTGDLAYIDEDHYVYLTGREKDLIIRGGHNLDPKRIEEAIHTIPEVALCAAIGRPDPYSGEVPVAYVQLKPGAQRSADEILNHLELVISEKAAIPKKIEFMDQIPVTSVGKIFKPTLRQLELKSVCADLIKQAGIAARHEIEVHLNPSPSVTIGLADGQGDSENIKQLVTLLGRFNFKYRLEDLPN